VGEAARKPTVTVTVRHSGRGQLLEDRCELHPIVLRDLASRHELPEAHSLIVIEALTQLVVHSRHDLHRLERDRSAEHNAPLNGLVVFEGELCVRRAVADPAH